MFVQVIQGKVRDQEQARSLHDTWVREIAPGSVGWLGSTAGFTGDGEILALARFSSPEDAAANGSRPEQTAWWGEMEANFDGAPRFSNSTSVDAEVTGDPGEAGFVQVMQGQVTDFQRLRALMVDDTFDLKEFRPEILGRLFCGHDDGRWTMAIWFTSEAEARAGEQKEPPPEFAARMAELRTLSSEEPSYFDLRDPWIDAPA